MRLQQLDKYKKTHTSRQLKDYKKELRQLNDNISEDTKKMLNF